MKKWRDLVSTTLGLIAAIFLGAMLVLTVADVTLRAVVNMPIRGVYDLVELFLAAMFFSGSRACFCATRTSWSIPSTTSCHARCLAETHRRAARRGDPRRARLAGLHRGRNSYEFHDVTADLGLPRYWHWAAVLIGLIGGALRGARHGVPTPATAGWH